MTGLDIGYYFLVFNGYLFSIFIFLFFLLRDSKTLHIFISSVFLINLGVLSFLFKSNPQYALIQNSHLKPFIDWLFFANESIQLFFKNEKSLVFFEYLTNGLNTIWLVVGFYLTNAMKEKFKKYPQIDELIIATSKEYQRDFIRLIIFIVLINLLCGAFMKAEFDKIPLFVLTILLILINIYFMYDSFKNIELVEKYGKKFESFKLNWKIINSRLIIAIPAISGLFFISYKIKENWFGTYVFLTFLLLELYSLFIFFKGHYSLQKMRAFKISENEWDKYALFFRDNENNIKKLNKEFLILCLIPIIIGLFYLLLKKL